ncbi:winged helix-turn-helix domain-containing protein [Solwaraspora sp. WMMD1047]|uniref:ArsR/SmtB family transcription factor n=1 Tax=Solwaraspora sp. WMMD1047 TaxID=3016102 RepID=UPI0024171A93|nr:winged helix-turn-helix domain-containing protein [Solwaraspora sp. WMMD1047]MDG4829612.1 winged helix-turn-helix domain-containing protein [Solwaraspora sp. WMMD1047]
MIRIHFTERDLVRLRLAGGPDPMWETLLSLHLLQNRTGGPIFQQWRNTVRRRLSPPLRPLLELAPPYGYSPDFLTPTAGADGVDAGIEALLATPRQRLRTDLRQLAAYRPLSSWTRSLADGERESLRLLATAVREYHRIAVAPYASRIQAATDAERLARIRVLAATGIEGMISSLHPDLRWRPPVLEVHGFRVTRDVHLDGRGLSLIPSFFCWEQPTLLREPDLPPVLVYPVADRLGPLGATATGPAGSPDAPLVALLGPTRAAVLEAVDAGCTTTELAQRVGVSIASASRHASVLRNAGLISTRRLGGSVMHSLRPLGAEILGTARTDATLDGLSH